MTMRRVLLVVRQELRTRLRTGRWRWLLAGWFVLVGVIAALLRSAYDGAEEHPGVPMFGTLLLLVLGLTLLIAPALTAQSINGDRERGTLATLQITRLTPAEIAVGKLLASWSVGLALLALAVPFIAWPVVGGDIPALRAVVVTLVVALLIGVVCAVSMALSALVVRSITAALLSYLTVFALMAGTWLMFFLALPLTANTDGGERPERVWWLLAPNPFVVLADAAPRLRKDERPPISEDGGFYADPEPFDPLGDLSRSVRESRTGSGSGNAGAGLSEAVWTYGLTFNLALGAGAVWVTARRLRIPVHKVSRGVRIA